MLPSASLSWVVFHSLDVTSKLVTHYGSVVQYKQHQKHAQSTSFFTRSDFNTLSGSSLHITGRSGTRF